MKMRFKSQFKLSSFAWLAAVVITICLLCFRLGSLLPGLAPTEQPLPTLSASLQAIWNRPVALPIDLSRLVVTAVVPSNGHSVSRLPNVLLALLLVMAMYWLLRRWYGYRLALFGSVLVATAPWFLHVGRLATTDIVYPLAMTLTLCLAAAWHQAERSGSLMYVSAAMGAALIYVPGIFWLLLCVLLFERRNVFASLRNQRRTAVLAGVISIIILIPLIHSLIGEWQLLRTFAGLPASLPTPLNFLKQCGLAWEHIFIRGYNQPLYNVGDLPMVNILISLAFVIGVYLYALHRKASRSQLLLGLWILATVLIAFGLVNISLILPIVAILATGGIGYLLHLWLKVFPRNPLARGFGIGLISCVIAFAVLYNIRNYYVAWPNSPTTRQAFQQQR